MTRIRLNREVAEPAFVAAYLHYLQQCGFFFANCQNHVNQASISSKFLSEQVEIPLAPLNEQRRIVEKLDELMGRLAAARAKLERVPRLLAHFRRAVLAAACSGALTRDWREENGDVEWNETTLGQLCSLLTSGSRGWAQYYSEQGAIFIRAQDINTELLDLNDVAHVSAPKGAEGARTKVALNDILITITGANVAKSALVTVGLEEAYVSQHVALVRLKQPELAAFVYLCVISPQNGKAHLLEEAYGAGKPGFESGQYPPNTDSTSAASRTTRNRAARERIIRAGRFARSALRQGQSVFRPDARRAFSQSLSRRVGASRPGR